MSETWIQREILAPRRLIFNIIWYGAQIGTFAYGWYSQVRPGDKHRNSADFLTGRQPAARSSQCPHIFCLEFSWRWFGPRSRWRPYSLAYVAQLDSYYPPQAHLAHACRRKYLVSSSSCLLDGFLGNGMTATGFPLSPFTNINIIK